MLALIQCCLVTPLDVVRVRLQSQHNSASTHSNQTFRSSGTLPRSFSNLPPNLGVTSCCREVFWVNNNAQYCVAETNVPFLDTSAPSTAECAIRESQRRQFTSTIDGLQKIARNEGTLTLWRGLSPTLMMAVPGNVIYFAGYDWLRSSKHSPINGRMSDTYAPLVAGSSARIIAALFVSPIELFRTRMQAHHSSSAAGNFRETLSGVKGMVQSQGPLTLWRGLTMTLWRDVPFSALYWWGYETTRNWLLDSREKAAGNALRTDEAVSKRRTEIRKQQNHTATLTDSFIAGAASGAFASMVTTPFDVGKTRQQVYRHAGDSAQSSMTEEAGRMIGPKDRSMARILRTIFKEEGVRGLFTGWIPRVMKVAPACAIMISSYEIGKKVARRAQKQDE